MEEKENIQTETATTEQTVNVETPVTTTSSDGFVCAEAGPIMEITSKEEPKENFFVKNKILIGGITAAVLTIVVLAFIFLPRISQMSVPSTDSGKSILDATSASDQLISALKLESGSELPAYKLFFNNSKEIKNEYQVKFYLEDRELTLDEVSEEENGKRNKYILSKTSK